MALLYFMIIFLVICFSVYYGYMLSIVGMPLYSSIEPYNAPLDDNFVGGNQCVNVVFIQHLLATAPYIPGCVVDRDCDRTVESFVVFHPSNIRLAGRYYYGSLVLLLIFLSNVHKCVGILSSCHDFVYCINLSIH
jgi:hypothetical protein